MAVDEGLNEILRTALSDTPGLSEKNMMGGTCFMIHGNMFGGAHRDKTGTGYFMFRVGKDNTNAAEQIGGGTVMQQGGRVMTGLYFVEADDCSDTLFEQWTRLALSHAQSLPPR